MRILGVVKSTTRQTSEDVNSKHTSIPLFGRKKNSMETRTAARESKGDKPKGEDYKDEEPKEEVEPRGEQTTEEIEPMGEESKGEEPKGEVKHMGEDASRDVKPTIEESK